MKIVNCFLRMWLLFFMSGVVSVSALSSYNSDNKEKPPNIILIMADDLGFETIGSYGGMYETPHLDKLASEGMRFSHAYSTPLCTPSRVQIMTGKYNFRNYIGFGLLDPAERTFGHLLQDAGYETAIIGKWQLLGNEIQQKLAGNQRGTQPVEAGFSDYLLWQVEELGSRYKDPTLSTNGKKTKMYEGEYGPDLFVEFAENYMEENRSGPFFLYYPMVLPHAPFQPTPDNPEFDQFQSEDGINDTTYFAEMVSYMDKIVGQLHKKMTDLDIEENTLLLFVGDNGTDRRVVSRLKDGREIPGRKGHTNIYGTHVPFIAYWKEQIESDRINENLIDFTDFLPTLIEAAQTDIPEDFYSDGKSFYSQLLGDTTKTRNWVFGHYDPGWGDWELTRYVHDQKWKLYENGNIYDIKNDPKERKPIPEKELNENQKNRIEKFQKVLKRLQ